MVDLIVYTQQPAGRFQYIMLAIDVFSRHVWGKPMVSNTGVALAETFKALAADIGPIRELNGDREFEQSRPLQSWLNNNNILFRAKRTSTISPFGQQYEPHQKADCKGPTTK